MSTLKLHAISFSRPTTLHNAQRLQRCRFREGTEHIPMSTWSTATKISAGNRSVLITRPQRHVVTSSLRREEATIATDKSELKLSQHESQGHSSSSSCTTRRNPAEDKLGKPTCPLFLEQFLAKLDILERISGYPVLIIDAHP
eukprot:1193266-Prorocentrum_minimum.AAC.3